MVPAIRRDHAKGVLFGRVDRIVEEDNLIGNLNDFGWRTYARKTLWSTLERRILMTLVLAQVLYLVDQFRFIGRQIGTFQPVFQLSHLLG
jgi:hypothetical protein